MNSSDLISQAYLAEQKRLHADPRGYGGKGGKWASVVLGIVNEFGAATVLDYGCGQGSLAVALHGAGFKWVTEYDPAIPGKDKLPHQADIVVCTDVLEHMEPELLETGLIHLQSLIRKAALVAVSVVPTAKTLSDGRQAHISLHNRDWWMMTLQRFFDVGRVLDDWKPEKQLVVVLTPKAAW